MLIAEPAGIVKRKKAGVEEAGVVAAEPEKRGGEDVRAAVGVGTTVAAGAMMGLDIVIDEVVTVVEIAGHLEESVLETATDMSRDPGPRVETVAGTPVDEGIQETGVLDRDPGAQGTKDLEKGVEAEVREGSVARALAEISDEGAHGLMNDLPVAIGRVGVKAREEEKRVVDQIVEVLPEEKAKVRGETRMAIIGGQEAETGKARSGKAAVPVVVIAGVAVHLRLPLRRTRRRRRRRKLRQTQARRQAPRMPWLTSQMSLSHNPHPL